MSPFTKGLIVGLAIPFVFHYVTGKLPSKAAG